MGKKTQEIDLKIEKNNKDINESSRLYKFWAFKWEYVVMFLSIAMAIVGIVLLIFPPANDNGWAEGTLLLVVGITLFIVLYGIWKKRKLVLYTIRKHDEISQQKEDLRLEEEKQRKMLEKANKVKGKKEIETLLLDILEDEYKKGK